MVMDEIRQPTMIALLSVTRSNFKLVIQKGKNTDLQHVNQKGRFGERKT
jgi:hypothetical protein